MSRGKYKMQRSTRKTLLSICNLQKYQCFYCTSKMVVDKTLPSSHPYRASLDHKIPLSRGGENKRRNLVACCFKCNQDKGNRTVTEYLSEKTIQNTIHH